MRSFRKGDVAASVKEFDEAMHLDPELQPYLWQRGLSLFYAGILSAHSVEMIPCSCARQRCQAGCWRPSPNNSHLWHCSPECINTETHSVAIVLADTGIICCTLEKSSHMVTGSCSATAEQYEEAAKQFRDDVAVNPSDTEEAIWAFLSEAKLLGSSEARQQFLQVGTALVALTMKLLSTA